MSRALQGDARPGLARYNANIELLQPTGSRTYATFKLGGAEVIAELQAHDVTEINQRVELTVNMNRAVHHRPAYRKSSLTPRRTDGRDDVRTAKATRRSLLRETK